MMDFNVSNKIEKVKKATELKRMCRNTISKQLCCSLLLDNNNNNNKHLFFASTSVQNDSFYTYRFKHNYKTTTNLCL